MVRRIRRASSALKDRKKKRKDLRSRSRLQSRYWSQLGKKRSSACRDEYFRHHVHGIACGSKQEETPGLQSGTARKIQEGVEDFGEL